MSDELRCSHCGRRIQSAPKGEDNWVACEHCGQKMYLAQPDEVEEIPLAPIDEQEERQAERRRAQDRAIADRALEGNYTPEEPATPTQPPLPAHGPSEDISGGNLSDQLAQYVVWMSQGEMSRCDEVVASLVGQQKKVHAAAQKLLKHSQEHPKLRDVPPAVVKGYLKQLLSQL